MTGRVSAPVLYVFHSNTHSKSFHHVFAGDRPWGEHRINPTLHHLSHCFCRKNGSSMAIGSCVSKCIIEWHHICNAQVCLQICNALTQEEWNICLISGPIKGHPDFEVTIEETFLWTRELKFRADWPYRVLSKCRQILTVVMIVNGVVLGEVSAILLMRSHCTCCAVLGFTGVPQG